MTTVRTLARLALTSAVGAALVVSATAAQPPANGTDPKAADANRLDVPVPAGNTLTLAECIAIGLDRQPNVRAARASLAAAEAGLAALLRIHPWTTVLAPDLPVRRQQASRGLIVAQADVQKAEQDTRYDVTRMYYTFVYARQQEKTASDIIAQLEGYYETAKGLVESGAQVDQVNQYTLYQIEAAISQAKSLRVGAVVGQPQALSALKEAMGVEQTFEFAPRDTHLPLFDGVVSREQVVSSALAARPELAQAAAGVDAFRLEVCAQQANRLARSMPTLAAGSDLHARFIPGPVRNGEYRPGALAPEMPTTLVGRRDDRVARAAEFSGRQDVVYDKTKALVELEALNAFHVWQAAHDRLKLATERFDRAKKLDALNRDLVATGSKRYDLIVQNEGLIAKGKSDYLEAVFEHVKALAALERVTAAGVRADFGCK